MKSEQNKSQNNPSNDIPEMNLDNKYSDKKQILPPDMEKMQKEMDKTKKELEKFKSYAVKKYPFVQVRN